ncbi:DUF4221 family protein [Mongoliitalea daihaiensis]|uniref:DUF4221 family protein n=1 Tax=Mongoliitalea daihaiensis TaxID=2782006 RepID=UPI001F391175|nr:DUF4221 family protein [Mongoliitalea daihaiensis]UJP65349.1 DUF4221 family protein [Mongoliitalea daihaiensis]
MISLIKKILFGAVLFACSCTGETDITDTTNQLLSLKKSVSLPLDDRSTYEFFVFQQRGDTLIVLNQPNHSLDFYSLSHEEMIYRLPIEKEGINGLDRLYVFHFHSPDSIFIFSQMLLKNSLIMDISGKVVDRIRHKEFVSDRAGLINHYGSSSAPNILMGSELHFSTLPLTNEGIDDKDYLHEHSLDIATGDFKTYDYINRPYYLQSHRWINQFFTRIKLGKEEWYYSWNISDTVYHIKGQDGRLLSSKAIAMHGGNPTKPEPITADLPNKKLLQLEMESYSYGKILLDKKREVIHRLRYLPTSLPEKPGQQPNAYLSKNFEYLTYTLEGEFLGSTQFKAGTYDPRVAFLGPDGIYLPKINPSFAGLREDNITYDVYGFK